jgi:hypothetical protein
MIVFAVVVLCFLQFSFAELGVDISALGVYFFLFSLEENVMVVCLNHSSRRIRMKAARAVLVVLVFCYVVCSTKSI